MRNNSNAEQERLKRLRDRQLADRDPLVEQQRFHKQAAKRGRDSFKPLSFKDVWADIPHIWKNGLYSLIIGAVVFLIVPTVWPSSYAILCVGGGTLALLIFGLAVGRALDSRDEIKRLTK